MCVCAPLPSSVNCTPFLMTPAACAGDGAATDSGFGLRVRARVCVSVSLSPSVLARRVSVQIHTQRCVVQVQRQQVRGLVKISCIPHDGCARNTTWPLPVRFCVRMKTHIKNILKFHLVHRGFEYETIAKYEPAVLRRFCRRR